MKLYHVTAFPKTPSGGNKAGVVLDAIGLQEKDMLEIANDVGYSETAFVFPSDKADFLVRFFTPQVEVDLCGHATIATFNLLRDQGIIQPGIYTQETKAGILQLNVQKDTVIMEQNPPQFFEEISVEEINRCFSDKDVVIDGLPIVVVSTAIKEIFLPIRSTEILHKLQPNFEEIIALAKTYDTIGIHAFSIDSTDCDAYSRNFAPVVGINEESATGTSNGALGCYLEKYVSKAKTNYLLRQGYSMGMPSVINTKLTIKNNQITNVYVGGTAFLIKEQVIR